jgi:hypothetical protein
MLTRIQARTYLYFHAAMAILEEQSQPTHITYDWSPYIAVECPVDPDDDEHEFDVRPM